MNFHNAPPQTARISGLFDELKLAMRFALREMRGGLSGFMIFLTCIALGTGAIGGVNSVAQAISDGVASEGRTLLGGDIRFVLVQREANPTEATFLNGLGAVSASANIRSMARLPDGSDQALVEAKAVDAAYPLYGQLETEPTLSKADLFGERDGAHGAVAPDLLLERLHLAIGDRIRLGGAEFELRAKLASEPDAVSSGFGFAPRLLISLEGLRASGLEQPGSLIEHVYKVRLPEGTGDDALRVIRNQAENDFPQAGWAVRTRSNAAPALAANIDRFSQFLTLVGLTVLIVGGVGVANAVNSYLDQKRGVIATFKSLGAPGRLIFSVYLIQILLIAIVGIGAGLVLAAIAPFAAKAALSTLLPIPTTIGFYPGALGLAIVFGILVTLAFAMLPLGRARAVPATALFREMGVSARGWPQWPYMATAGAMALLLFALVVWFSDDRRIALTFAGAALISFVILRLVAFLVQWLAKHSPRSRFVSLRLAIDAIHRPGALTPSVVLSLGLGLTLLATIALIDGSLRQQISGTLPEQAPNFFFMDIQSTEADAFTKLIGEVAPAGKLVRTPMLRGRIMALNGVDAQKITAAAAAWVLRGDRGVTYSADAPENAVISAGQWWSKDYSGKPLVSFAGEEARQLGLKVGDTVTVNVLGRNITAEIANLREVRWESLNINFVMVFSPNTFAGAPHSWLATLQMPEANEKQDAAVLNQVVKSFPSVTAVRVKDALDVINRLVEQLGDAVRAVASIALLASVLVLAGALAAGNQARIHDAVILKTLGATRRLLFTAFSLEFALIGLATSAFAIAAGLIAAWFVVSQIMSLPVSLSIMTAASVIITALVLTVGFGLIGTWRVLGHKAAPVLREL